MGALIASALMIASAGIILTLGVIHLVYTFWGNKLTPRDPALQTQMTEISPVLTRETTMWRAWIGFNASHSSGAILFGLTYGYLAVAQREVLFNSPFFVVVGLAMLAGWLFVGKFYWFSVPFRGICIALVCYVFSI